MAREMAEKRRREREERERRVVDLAAHVMVAIGQRDAAVAETVVVSSAAQNRHEWAVQRRLPLVAWSPGVIRIR